MSGEAKHPASAVARRIRFEQRIAELLRNAGVYQNAEPEGPAERPITPSQNRTVRDRETTIGKKEQGRWLSPIEPDQRAAVQRDSRPENELECRLPRFVVQELLSHKRTRPAAQQRKDVQRAL